MALLCGMQRLRVDFNAMGILPKLPPKQERRLKERRSIKLPDVVSNDLPVLMHELEVHRIELEMQNEELRNAQLALEESRDSYLDLYDFAPVGYLSLDRNGLIEKVNLTGASLLQVERSKLIHRRFNHFIAADNIDFWHLHLSSVSKNKEVLTIVLKLKRGDGTYFQGQLVCGLQQGNYLTKSVNIVLTDITEQFEADEKLRESAVMIASLYNNAPCGYHSVNAGGTFLLINDTELKWLGYSREELIGKKKIADLLTNKSCRNFDQTFNGFLKTGKTRDLEAELVRKDGTILPVMINATAIFDAQGHFVASRSTVYDMTERIKMEQERYANAKRLEQKSHRLVATQEEARRRLSSELHDRTSPNLAAININLNIIASNISSEVPAEIAERLEDTRALIADTTSSIREICADMRPPLLDYAGLVAALESYLHQFSRRTGIEVEFDCTDRSQRGSNETESLLFRIIQEAVTNCAKHAQASTVSVIFSNAESPWSLTITDNGIGFDQSLLGKEQEVGLGVINMREMSEVAGGRFTLESGPGQGTRIVVDQLVQ
jgi:PAS domain S-box-containing protein